MSILFVSNFLSGVGSRGVCEELSCRLSTDGVEVITTSSKAAKIPRLFDMLQTVWLRRNDYQFAHVAVFSGAAFLWAEATCALLRLAGKPYALTLHGGNLPIFARRYGSRVRRLLQTAQLVTAPSPYLCAAMSPYRNDILLVENALDISRYPYRHRTRLEPTLVWLRAFHEIYNPSLAPEVLKQISHEFPGARLIMVGPDKKDGSLEKAKSVAKRLGVERNIQFVGPVDKSAVPQWLSLGDIFLNTTNVDNTPVSVIEAMACGLCVVSTNVGGIPHLLTDGLDALVVPPGDSAVMAGAVLRLLSDHTLASAVSHQARLKAETYDWSIVLPKWRRLMGVGDEARIPLCQSA